MFEMQAENYADSVAPNNDDGYRSLYSCPQITKAYQEGAQMVYDTEKSIVNGICKNEEQRLKDVENRLITQLNYLAAWSKNDGRA